MPSMHAIEHFLAQEHLAFVGASRDSRQFANSIYRHLRAGGRTMSPVNRNPGVTTIEGDRCYERLTDVPDPVDGVVVMVPAQDAAGVVRDAVQRGIPRVWLHRGLGPNSVSAEASPSAIRLESRSSTGPARSCSVSRWALSTGCTAGWRSAVSPPDIWRRARPHRGTPGSLGGVQPSVATRHCVIETLVAEQLADTGGERDPCLRVRAQKGNAPPKPCRGLHAGRPREEHEELVTSPAGHQVVATAPQ